MEKSEPIVYPLSLNHIFLQELAFWPEVLTQHEAEKEKERQYCSENYPDS